MYKIEQVANEELHLIKNIAYTTWPVAYENILSKEQLEYMLSKMYSIAALLEQKETKKHNFIKIKHENEAVGFASFELNFNDSRQTKIHKIYILPDYQGKSAGKCLVEFIENRAKEESNTHLILNVNRYNSAIHFYKKIGFNISYSEDIDIGNGFLMEDHVMIKQL